MPNVCQAQKHNSEHDILGFTCLHSLSKNDTEAQEDMELGVNF